MMVMMLLIRLSKWLASLLAARTASGLQRSNRAVPARMRQYLGTLAHVVAAWNHDQ